MFVTRAIVDRLDCGLASNHRALCCGSIAHGFRRRGCLRRDVLAVSGGASSGWAANQTVVICMLGQNSSNNGFSALREKVCVNPCV